jgi:hypothetical protein
MWADEIEAQLARLERELPNWRERP